MAESSNQLCDARRFCKPCADDFSGHGFAEEMALSFVAAMGLDLPHLLFRLDALGDHPLVEAGAKTGDCTDDLGVALFAQALNERPIDLDLLEGEFTQVVERRLTRPEVVERNADTQILELLHRRQRSVAVLEQQALRDFKLQALRGQTGLRQGGNDVQS